MSLFHVHKPGQAKLSRMVTLLSGLFLVAWGGRSLLRALPTFWPSLGDSINQTWGGATDKDAWHVNVVLFNEKLSVAFLVAAILVVGLSLWWWRFLNKERWAETLIDMANARGGDDNCTVVVAFVVDGDDVSWEDDADSFAEPVPGGAAFNAGI